VPFFNLPVLTPIDESGIRTRWRVVHPFIYVSLKYKGRRVYVPRDFETDLASVPRLPLLWLFAGGSANAAAVVHDYLCQFAVQTPQSVIDGIFYEAMRDTGVPVWRAYAMWLAVRAFSPFRRKGVRK